MSSSVWNYPYSLIRFFAEDIREGRRDGDDTEPLGSPTCRYFLADVLIVVADLVKQLDQSFTGDDAPIYDEPSWVRQAHMAIERVMPGAPIKIDIELAVELIWCLRHPEDDPGVAQCLASLTSIVNESGHWHVRL
jgi:hypothetical protein